MRIHLYLGILLTLFFRHALFSQQLVINEVSQGPSGSKEFVELVVVGTPTCNSIPCMDLRNYIIDDNNGNHATGGGTGIASGCVRLANIPFWSCIPVGTIILFYNSSDLNAAVPPVDLSMSDNNCRLVIPISDCTLLERHTSQPSTANAAYPTTGFTSCGGTWAEVSMANGDDSFQVINPAGGMAHAVSWGNNSASTIIYFSGGAGGNVIRNLNTVNTNPANQANWSMVSAAGNETPGSPNNAANASWINSMSNSCQPLLPFTASVSAAGLSCGCSGSATVTATGGIAPYTYTWLPSGPTSSVASNLCSGIYTVIAASSNGCTQTNTFQIVSPPGSIAATVSSKSITCFGFANGSATATPSGGSPGYTYTWSPSGGNAAVANNLAPGTYTVRVKDAAGCFTTVTTVITQAPTGITGTVNKNNATCAGATNGSASVTVSSGISPYTYTWVPSGGNATVAGNLAAGNYSVLLTDANSCTVALPFQITQPPAITAGIASHSVGCFGAATGAATVTAAGGTGGYTYFWSPSLQTTSVTNGLSAGTHTVFITDANNCSATAITGIAQPSSSLAAVVSSTPTFCGAANGFAEASGSGGTPGYSYAWSPGGNTSSVLTGLLPGVYTATITDINNCSVVQTATVNATPVVTSTLDVSNVTCNGFANGSATMSASGGVAPYTVTWLPANLNSYVINGLPPGSYSVTVSDTKNCGTVNTFTVTEPTALILGLSSTSVSCFGQSSGSATVTASGGSPAYTYTWMPTGYGLPVHTNLGAGTYSVQVKDSKNCSVTGTVAVTQPAAPLAVLINKNNISCYGMNDGSLNAQASGGTPGYLYVWSTGANLSTINALAPGPYQLQVIDLNGCQVNAAATLTQTAMPLIAAATLTHVTCYNGTNGAALLTASGGDAGYTYSWTPQVSASSAASGLTAGNYTVTVSDSRNCTVSVAFVLNQSPAFSVTANPLKLCGGSNGTLSAQTNGGNPPFIYHWNGMPQASSTLAITAAANTIYTVYAVDALGCTSSPDTAMVQVPVPLTLTAQATASVCEGSQASLVALAAGGDGVFNYAWQPGGFHGSVYQFTPTATRFFTVTVTDGCLASRSATVALAYYPLPVSDITYVKSDCLPVCTTFSNLPLQVSGTIRSYRWNFDNVEIKTDSMPYHCFTRPGKHTVELTYTTKDGCSGKQAINNIFIDSLPNANFMMDKKEIDGYNPGVNFTNLSHKADTYYWSFNNEGWSDEKDPSFTFVMDGDKFISLVVTNEKGCSDTAIEKLDFKQEYTFYAPNIFTPDKNGLNDVFMPTGIGWDKNRYEMIIYDRWGELIFETKVYNSGWDGTVKHRSVKPPNDAYVWKVNLFDMAGRYHQYIGFVILQ